MTFTILLKESRAQLVINKMDNGTSIISECDVDGWVKLNVVIDSSWDTLQLYHAGMDAQQQQDSEWWKQHSKERAM